MRLAGAFETSLFHAPLSLLWLTPGRTWCFCLSHYPALTVLRFSCPSPLPTLLFPLAAPLGSHVPPHVATPAACFLVSASGQEPPLAGSALTVSPAGDSVTIQLPPHARCQRRRQKLKTKVRNWKGRPRMRPHCTSSEMLLRVG